MKLNKRLLIVFLITYSYSVNLFAISVQGTPGSVVATTIPSSALTTFTYLTGATTTDITNGIQSGVKIEIDKSFLDAVAKANTDLAKFNNQTKLAQGFAEANAFAAHAATFQGYQNYDKFAVGAGYMIGVQMPSIDPEYYSELDKKIQQEGDVYAGIGMGITMLNVGLHGGWLMSALEDFYFNLKFGGISLEGDMGGTGKGSYSNANFGLGMQYALVKSSGIAWGLFRWRGLSVGSGLLFNKSSMSFTPQLEEIRQPIANVNTVISGQTITSSGTLIVNPSATLKVDSTTMTVPLEMVTSVQLLWVMNFTLGAGVDLIMGKTDINVTADARARVEAKSVYSSTDIATIDVSNYILAIDGSTKGIKPQFARGRLIAGVGLNIGPVKIDVPVFYYITGGASVGVTAAIVW